MSIPSALAICRSELVSLVKSIVRLLLWGVLIVIGALTVFVLRQALHVLDVQTSVAFGLMFVSLLAISSLAKSQAPDRKTWIGVHAGIVAAGVAAVSWVPQWSGYIVGIALVLFAFTPNVLRQLAHRRAAAGYERAAAFYARLVCLFHPSRQIRFDSSFLTARALGSTGEKIAAYRALASHATPQQSALLNCWISIDQDDWEGVLGQLRSAGDTTGLKWLEIRALGELGRIDEMIMTYASAESVLSASNLPFCRLYVLAFSGRADAVRSLLSRQLRFVRPRNKAYWISIAGQTAETRDEEARRVLASYVRGADDETFRRTAQRHLDAGPTPGGAALCAESRATIAAIEKTLGKTKRDSALTR
jgi:hypothetical protein